MKKDQTFIRSLKGWISGNAGLQEERELQQLAQDDPFLTDALDGYQSTAGEDHDLHLQSLRKRLAIKDEKRRGLPILLRVAAGGAILIAALFALQLVNSGASDQIGEAVPATESVEENAAPPTERDEAVAKQEAISPAEEEEQAEVPPSKPAPAVAANENAQPKPQAKPRKKASSPTQVAAAKEKKPTVAAGESRDERIAAADIEEKSVAFEDLGITEEEELMEREEAAATARSAGVSARKREQAPSPDEQVVQEEAPLIDSFSPPASPKPSVEQNALRKISGMVTDINGKPIVGAKVSIPGTEIGTLTNFDGQFTIPVNSLNPELVFSSTGFESKRLDLTTVDIYKIRLDADVNAIRAIAASESQDGKSRKRAKNSFEKTIVVKASGVKDLSGKGVSPEGGLKQLNRIIRKNATKLEVNYTQARQSVSLTFNVGPGNIVTQVKIVESQGLLMDQEAIRLIQLTKWELEPTYRATGATVYCKVQF